MTPEIEWSVWEPEPRCEARRGPYSRIQCELKPGHEDGHISRGRRGQVFTWDDPS